MRTHAQRLSAHLRLRQDGKSGYLWSFSTPTVGYFTYPKTRAGHVVTDVPDSDYKVHSVS